MYPNFEYINLKVPIYISDELFPELLDEDLPVPENQTVSNTCPFMEHVHLGSEWAYKAPVFIILACNMLILIYIMTVRLIVFLVNKEIFIVY